MIRSAVAPIAVLALVIGCRHAQAQDGPPYGEFGPAHTDVIDLLKSDLDEAQARRLVEDLRLRLVAAGAGEVSARDLWVGAMAGMVAAYNLQNPARDEAPVHAALLSGPAAAAVESAIQGQMVGLGVEVQPDASNGALRVVRVVRGASADRAGLRAGDVVLSVDRKSVVGRPIEAVLASLQGPAGSRVQLGFVRASAEGPIRLQADLVREAFHLRSTSEGVLPDGTGVLRIDRFFSSTPEDVQAALGRLEAQGVDRVVVDLRGNTGGDLRAAVRTAALLGCGGAGVRVERPGTAPVELRADLPASWSGGVAVLINGWTYGSAEALAVLLREERGAVLAGEATRGGGAVETLVPMGGGLQLRLPDGLVRTLDGTGWVGGVVPDQVVTAEGPMVFGIPPSLGLDPQLDSAVHLLEVTLRVE